MWPSWRREVFGRDGDPDIWGELYDRFNPPAPGATRRPPRGPMADDSKARLLDAALGIVGALRTFVEVAEDVLLEQRERLRVPERDPRRHEHRPPPQPGVARDDSPAVEDIPMEPA